MKTYEQALDKTIELIMQLRMDKYMGGAMDTRIDITPYAQALGIAYNMQMRDVYDDLKTTQGAL